MIGAVPSDYQELLSFYTHRGFRVIAVATKNIPKLNWIRVQKMTRPEAESDLEFVGFIIFENKLKSSTTDVIRELGEAGVRRIMCTGDNILTAISVARECDLIRKGEHCFVPRFAEGKAKTRTPSGISLTYTGDSSSALARLTWESIDNASVCLDANTLKVRHRQF